MKNVLKKDISLKWIILIHLKLEFQPIGFLITTAVRKQIHVYFPRLISTKMDKVCRLEIDYHYRKPRVSNNKVIIRTLRLIDKLKAAYGLFRGRDNTFIENTDFFLIAMYTNLEKWIWTAFKLIIKFACMKQCALGPVKNHLRLKSSEIFF